jgi:hypothetical protein
MIAREDLLRIETVQTVALWLTYAASAAVVLWLARRLVGGIPGRAGIVLALLPLVFTGKAMLLGRLYGPSDLYFTANPWKSLSSLPSSAAIGPPRNAILSDLAFANLPWRAAVREAAANGRAPLWNRFVLAGTPLLPAAQAGILHPSTLLSLPLPLALSWTFSCTFTLFLALVCGFLFFRDLSLGVVPSLLGAAAWAFSTYVVFWDGWSVGPSTASLPLLLLAVRRLAREPGRASILLTAIALVLSVFGGHPESAFHGAAAAGVYFLCELFGTDGAALRRRAVASSVAAGGLAILLSGPQLLPLLEAIPHSAEYRARHSAAAGPVRQSVALSASVPRLLPDLLPFAHGIYGRSPVQEERGDGSGMPLGYAGALLFPLGGVGLAVRGSGRLHRERNFFVAVFVAGLLYGASVPGLIDLTSRLPGFALALNYRLVFLAGLGLAGLAAIGAQRLIEEETARPLAFACAGWTILIACAFVLSLGVFRERALPASFVGTQLALELLPVVILLALAIGWRGPGLAAGALVLLVAQRGAEMGGVYPTLPASTLAPPLPALASVPLATPSEPCRVVAAGETLRPNGAALYRLEDVRGYESLVLDRFTDTYPLWSQAQPASFNRVADLSRPFLSFLNACWAVAGPGEPVPAGWREQARGAEMSIFENPHALPRAFVPRRLRRVANPRVLLAEMSRATDASAFAETAWLSEPGAPEEENGPATLFLRSVGPDLVVEVQAAGETLVVTSIPDWPGWTAREDELPIPTVTVNHAFVGMRVPAGRHVVRLAYRPRSWPLGLAAFGAGVLLIAVAGAATRPRRAP